jgi:hypothetical protein
MMGSCDSSTYTWDTYGQANEEGLLISAASLSLKNSNAGVPGRLFSNSWNTLYGKEITQYC